MERSPESEMGRKPMRRKGNEHVKAIALRSGNVLGSPEDPNQEVNIENTNDLQERPLKAKDDSELEEVVASEFEPDVETTKDSIVEKISFPSRLEKKQMRDEDEFEEEVRESEEEGEDDDEEDDEMDFEKDD
ncbi:uncharacterized protein LOC105787023 [Gossypium raimondii]|uniref:uncharacterized protein LOC105787023 n=1 Tax=Gossypium raimondii TaxID=29730 RepID=UPI00063AAFFC|nr:uncharacterized protein LOC105787023 [Gossypium raimondii]